MNGSLYDIDKTYEQNLKDGPPLFAQDTKPQLRTITTKQKFLGFDINMPFGIAAGPLPSSQFLKAAFDFGFDINHYKTQRSVAFKANKFPNMLFLDIDGDLTLEKTAKPILGTRTTTKPITEYNVTNSFGNPSVGPDFWQEDMKKALSFAKDGQLLIGSAVGTIKEGFSADDYYKDFATTAKLIKETGVKVIEINLSCPNVASEGVLCYTKEAVEKTTRYTKEAIGNTPLLIKLGYFDQTQQQLLEETIKAVLPFIAGVAAINTIPAKVVDAQGNQALPGPNRLSAGICGAGIGWAGLDMVVRLSQIREKIGADFAIVGVGGVMQPADYKKYRAAGADVVQSATAAMWNPNLAYEIWQENK